MKVLALDLGSVRVGVAVSAAGMALPLAVLRNDAELKARLAEIARERGVDRLLFGQPTGLSGSPTAATVHFGEMAAEIAESLDLPYELVDERFSSRIASRALADAGVSSRDRRGRVDDLAAAGILQAWLDSRA